MRGLMRVTIYYFTILKCHIRTDPQIEDSTQAMKKKPSETQPSKPVKKIATENLSNSDNLPTVKATPATRAFAKRNDVDIGRITGRYVCIASFHRFFVESTKGRRKIKLLTCHSLSFTEMKRT